MSVLVAVASFLLRYLVVALMFSIGLAARPRDLARIWREPRMFVRPILVMELGVPLLAMATLALLPLSHVTTGLVLLMAVCPGAPFIPRATRGKGEPHSPYGLELLVIVSLLAPLMVPLWVSIIDRLFPYDLGITPAAVVRKVAPLVLAPLFMGLLVRRFLPPGAADRLAAAAELFVRVAMVMAIGFALYHGTPILLEMRPVALIVLVVIVGGSAWMGYWAGPRDDPAADRATSVAATLGNPGLVFAVAAASHPGFKAAAFVAAYLIARKLVLVPIEWWIARRSTRARPSPTGAVPV